jgi:hypothetical protein
VSISCREHPDKWKDLEGKWDEKFKDIKVEITVNIKADGAGRSVKPDAEEGKDGKKNLFKNISPMLWQGSIMATSQLFKTSLYL